MNPSEDPSEEFDLPPHPTGEHPQNEGQPGEHKAKERRPKQDDVSHAELLAARNAIQAGDFAGAERHLDQAAHMGASHKQISDLGRSAQRGREAQRQRIRSSRRWGFWLGLLGYIALSFQQPLGWGMGLWIVLAFLLLPGLIGIIVAWRQGPVTDARSCFWAAWGAAGWDMFLYAGISLFIVGAVRLDNNASSAGGHFIAAVLTLALFTVIAAGVAGLVSSWMRRQPKKEGAHEPAS